MEILEIKMYTLKPKYNNSLYCNNILYYPSSVRTNKFPLQVNNYTYDLNEKNDEDNILSDDRQLILLKLNKPQNDLISFGIWGRIYNRDTVGKIELTENQIKEYIRLEELIFKKEARDNSEL